MQKEDWEKQKNPRDWLVDRDTMKILSAKEHLLLSICRNPLDVWPGMGIRNGWEVSVWSEGGMDEGAVFSIAWKPIELYCTKFNYSTTDNDNVNYYCIIIF